MGISFVITTNKQTNKRTHNMKGKIKPNKFHSSEKNRYDSFLLKIEKQFKSIKTTFN